MLEQRRYTRTGGGCSSGERVASYTRGDATVDQKSMPLALTEWIDRVRSEYLEMPGLSLTRPQMLRLWHLDSNVCDAVIDTLVESHFLRHRPDHTYVLDVRT